jgi:general stress protein 26
MAREEDTGKSTEELVVRAWEIVRKCDSVILVTVDEEEIYARPMSPRLDDDETVIHFLTDTASRKVRQIASGHDRAVVFCQSGNGYVSFRGKLTRSDDREKMRALWSAFDAAWWESPDDPSLCLLTFNPTAAELWDKPNALTAAALLLVAKLTGEAPRLGDHAPLPAH